MMRKKIRASLVVLSWNGWGLMHRQMMDLNTMMPDDCELVWIDNGSTESGFEQGAKWWVNNFPKELNYFRFEKNQGFQVGNNKGIQLAAGDIVIILNPDVKILRADFVDVIDKMLQEYPDALIGGRLIDWDAGWNQLDGKTYPYLEGYVLAARKKTWLTLGGFDERYFPANMEDVDLSMTAAYFNFKLLAMPPGYFHHVGGQSFKANKFSDNDRMELTQTNKKKFDEKWRIVFSREVEYDRK